MAAHVGCGEGRETLLPVSGESCGGNMVSRFTRSYLAQRGDEKRDADFPG